MSAITQLIHNIGCECGIGGISPCLSCQAETEHKILISKLKNLEVALQKAADVIDIAADWHLEEVEINGKMQLTRSVAETFRDIAKNESKS